jgi:hypothetical protein
MMSDLKKKHTENFKNMGVEFCIFRVTSYKERLKRENSQTIKLQAIGHTLTDGQLDVYSAYCFKRQCDRIAS